MAFMICDRRLALNYFGFLLRAKAHIPKKNNKITKKNKIKLNFLFNCTFDEMLLAWFIIKPIACLFAWWEVNESEILLFNSFHIHYKKLMKSSHLLLLFPLLLHRFYNTLTWTLGLWPFCQILSLKAPLSMPVLNFLFFERRVDRRTMVP